MGGGREPVCCEVDDGNSNGRAAFLDSRADQRQCRCAATMDPLFVSPLNLRLVVIPCPCGEGLIGEVLWDADLSHLFDAKICRECEWHLDRDRRRLMKLQLRCTEQLSRRAPETTLASNLSHGLKCGDMNYRETVQTVSWTSTSRRPAWRARLLSPSH